jgi:small subunit ribosomal protein S18
MADSQKVKEEQEKEKETRSFDDVFENPEVEEEEDDNKKKKQHKLKSRKRSQMDLSCPLCEAGVKVITYKDVYQLKKYTSVRGKIIGREKSGMCAKHQRQLSRAIKKARYVALLPYVSLSK